MLTPQRPGVTIKESLLPVVVASSPQSPPQAFAGEHPRGPEQWTHVSSWSEFTRLYGGFAEAVSNLAIAAYLYFAQRGGNLFIGRVIGANSTVATGTLVDRDAVAPQSSITINAISPGTWGNSIQYEIVASSLDPEFFTLKIYYGGSASGNRVETWQHLTVDETSNRYAPAIVNGSSNYVTVTNEGSTTATPNPADQAPTPLANGASGDAVIEADKTGKVAQLDTVPGPVVLSLPGEVDTNVMNNVIAYAENREDLFVIADTPQGQDVTSAIAHADTLSGSSFAAAYYPWLWVNDPSSSIPGALRLVPPSGLVAGAMARVDTERGVFRAPAGSLGRLSGVVKVERQMSNTDLENLNRAHLNVIKPVTGLGITPYGVRTLKKTLEVDRYISARRTLITIKRALHESLQFAVFESNDEALWLQIISVCNGYLDSLWQEGGLRGVKADEAYYTKCDAENNPIAQVTQGIVNVEVGVALQRPAEFVVVQLQEFAGSNTAIEV